MTHVGAVPFTLKRSSDVWRAEGYTAKTETAHGLARLEADRLVIQWRTRTETESFYATSYGTKEEIHPVKEISIPLTHVASASVPRRWWSFLTGPRLEITASDLLAFEEIAGGQGLRLKHPAKLALRIKRADRLVAEEFAAELILAVARLPDGKGDSRRVALGTGGPPGGNAPDLLVG